MKKMFKSIYNGIKRIINVLRWLPILWKDRDWDYCFLVVILKTKLTHMKKYMEKSPHVDHKNNLFYINICIKLIDKLWIEEYYTSEVLDYLEIKHYFIPISGSTNYELKHETIRDDTQEYINKNKKFGETNVYKLAHKKHNKAKKLLFKILEEKLEHFWD